MTTNAIPTSSLVPWIVALHAVPGSVDGPTTAIWAFKMVAANLRPWPTWLMRWPAMESGTHRVQHTCGDSAGCKGADGAVHWAGLVPPVGFNEVDVAFTLSLFGFP
jgi:hypothetical protein